MSVRTLADGADAFFVQVPHTQVLAFTRELWTQFDMWRHSPSATASSSVPLQRDKQCYAFNAFPDAVAVYDSFFELQPDRLNHLTDQFRDYDYTLDLYGTKSCSNLRAKYVLTSRRCRNPIASFGKTLWPIELNIVAQVPGREVCMCRTEDVRWDRLSQLQLWHSNDEYFARGRTPRIKTVLKLAVARLLKRF